MQHDNPQELVTFKAPRQVWEKVRELRDDLQSEQPFAKVTMWNAILYALNAARTARAEQGRRPMQAA